MILAAGVLVSGCAVNGGRSPLARSEDVVVLYAGSLVGPVETDVVPVAARLGLRVEGVGGGTYENLRLLEDGVKRADLWLGADPAAVDAAVGDGRPFAWHVAFLANELVIAYAPGGPRAQSFERAARGEAPWYAPLLAPGVRFGRTDPAVDPKGARWLVALRLAARQGAPPELARLAAAPDYPETSLMALLDAGQLDAAVAYRSEAVERGLPFVPLPAPVNLGDPSFADAYAQVTVALPGGGRARGALITYDLAIPRAARRPGAAARLAAWLLSPEGDALWRRHGFRPIPPRVMGDGASMPAVLRRAVAEAATRWNGGSE